MTCWACDYESCWVCLADYGAIRNAGNHLHSRNCIYYRAIEMVGEDEEEEV
jgi:hypothetical protein